MAINWKKVGKDLQTASAAWYPIPVPSVGYKYQTELI